MKIGKVINNNVVSSFDENGQEIILVGTGIGFQGKEGKKINETKIQKIFRPEDPGMTNRLKELLMDLPMEQLEVSTEIIEHAKRTLDTELNENIYITINQQLVKFNSDYSSQEVVLDGYYTAFSEDENNYYYLDANNNYIKMDKASRQEDVLLMNVYYVHKIDNLVYYQNDEDNESIHCLDLSSNQDTKINDEVSYCLMVDQKEKRIFYTNLDNELISISLEGKDKQVLGENTSLYTYDGVYLYYLTDQGVMRCNLDGDEKLIYESANLELINMIGDKLIVQEDNTLYQMNRDGKNVEEIYTSITDMTFEVIGEQLLVLSTEDYNQFSYQIVNLDGTSKSLTENQSGLIGNEV